MCSITGPHLNSGGRSTSLNSSKPTSCPACGAYVKETFFELAAIPVNCSALWKSEGDARSCRTGELGLSLCECCGLVFNRYFDATQLNYDENYDNTLDFSPAFRGYAQGLSSRLRDTYGLRHKRIVEIGSGRGEFLKMLSREGENACTGYDPTFDGEGSNAEGIRFIKDHYTDRYASEPVDFVVCRHVLEHIEEPLDFLTGLRQTLADQGDTNVYFEVPNGLAVLAGSGLWDIIYPHIQYFTPESIYGLFQRSGFTPTEVGVTFSGQYLYLEARAGSAKGRARPLPVGMDISVNEIAETFAARFQDTVAQWSAVISDTKRETKRIAFWGAGAKGVTFLNVVPGARDIEDVIDVNPRKQGMHVPSTGQRISAPSDLARHPPDLVITLNPVYVTEISSALRSLGMHPAIVSSPEQRHPHSEAARRRAILAAQRARV